MFWQFTIRTIEELDIVANQNLSIEMFLMRLMYLNSKNIYSKELEKKNVPKTLEKKKIINEFKSDAIDQIKNIAQEKR